MLFPDRPFEIGTLYGYSKDPESGERERFVISDPPDLDKEFIYAKERRLVEEVKAELAQGRLCQVFAVYTQKRDVTQRLKNILSREGIRVEELTTAVPQEAREAWYERQLKAGMQVCLAHPKLVATGLDLLAFPSFFFYESGYSIYTLRQASRRSWRIGQKQPVKVKFLTYAGTMQENCLRLMGKKLLVSLAMEGKFANYGLQALDDDDDMLTAMARELVTQKGVGERADALWKDVQRQHMSLVGTAKTVMIDQCAAKPVEVLPPAIATAYPSEPQSTEEALTELLSPPPRAVRKPHHDNDAQLSLAF